MAEWNLFYCGSNQSPFRVGKIIFWKYFWEVIYIRATAGIKQFCLFCERSTIALKSNFLGNGWMKFFQMWLKSKVFWHKKNDLLSPWWKNHFPLSHSWIYKFYLITVRYWKMLILRTTEIHFRTLVSLPKENMFKITSMRDPERFFSQILCSGECPQGWVCTQVYIILPLFWT